MACGFAIDADPGNRGLLVRLVRNALHDEWAAQGNTDACECGGAPRRNPAVRFNTVVQLVATLVRRAGMTVAAEAGCRSFLWRNA